MIEEFQAFRQLLCICPCCGDIVRVSDLKIRSKDPAPATWLDEYDKKTRLLDKKEERFEEKAEEIRQKAVERGRVAAERAVMKAISEKLRSLRLDPYDVKPVLYPVDFAVFCGMTNGECVRDIMMLSSAVRNPALNILRKQVQDAILAYRYDWKVARIDDEGKITLES